MKAATADRNLASEEKKKGDDKLISIQEKLVAIRDEKEALQAQVKKRQKLREEVEKLLECVDALQADAERADDKVAEYQARIDSASAKLCTNGDLRSFYRAHLCKARDALAQARAMVPVGGYVDTETSVRSLESSFAKAQSDMNDTVTKSVAARQRLADAETELLRAQASVAQREKDHADACRERIEALKRCISETNRAIEDEERHQKTINEAAVSFSQCCSAIEIKRSELYSRSELRRAELRAELKTRREKFTLKWQQTVGVVRKEIRELELGTRIAHS